MASRMEAWDRIERWLSTNAPTIAVGLQPPATPEAIAKTEDVLAARLPEDVREAYLRHDGQAPGSPWLMYGWEWLSMARIRDEWSVWKGLLDDGVFEDNWSDGDGEVVRQNHWNPGWIPVTYDGWGNHHCVDLDPGPQGRRGQVIEMWHDDDPRPMVDTSFGSWVTRFADALEAGDFVLREDYNRLVNRNDV